jgi:hypothetical protein
MSALCALCGDVENTMHLFFECARCSEPLRELVGEEITAFIRQASLAAQAYRIHAHSAINNIYDGQVPRQHADQVIAGKSSFKFQIQITPRCEAKKEKILGYESEVQVGTVFLMKKKKHRSKSGTTVPYNV